MNIVFIGGGNMADALISGLLKKKGGFRPQNLRVVEVNPDTRERLAAKHPGVKCIANAQEAAIEDGDVVIFAVKPQDMENAAKELRDKGWTSGLGPISNLIISIAAGVRLTPLARWLRSYCLVRAMPNTPALIGKGITALYPFPNHVSEAQMQQAERILGAVGETVRINSEGDMDTVTAVSGSGPAYVFLFIEALEQAAKELGISPDTARKLAIHTFAGASKLAEESPDPVSILRERVTSKGGTTESALASLSKDGVKEAIIRAIRAAKERGKELGDALEKD